LIDVLSHRDVAAVTLDLGWHVRGIARVRELVEDDDILACGDHPLDEVRADKARPASNKDAHGLTV
jgi:hypothetical protein